MQLVKVHWPHLRKYRHKLTQILQALRIERNHTKGEILARYLNLIPFGEQVTGVGEACHYFFGKDCSRLTLAEACTLAVIPRNPSAYTGHVNRLKTARNRLVVEAAKELGADRLTKEQALTEEIDLQKNKPSFEAPHLVLRARADHRDAKSIKTTLDFTLQMAMQKMLAEAVRRTPRLGDTGAILIAKNATAEVLAYVGSPDFCQPQHGMVDATQSLRSPGSALKPFVYALALESGFRLSSLLPDLPTQFRTENGVHVPSNYGGNFSGPQQIRYALANSQNIPALYLTSELGATAVLEFLRKMSFQSLRNTAEHYGVGVSLGNGEVTLWELTQAYSTLARSGKAKALRYLASTKREMGHRVLSPEVSYLIADVLADPSARESEFGRGGSLEFDYPVGVKTGTSSDYRDHWTVGFTRDYTVGVWRGNANGKPMRSRVSAARNTGWIFHDIMELLHRDAQPRWLHRPPGLVARRVCSLSGQIAGPHCHATRGELFQAGHVPQGACSVHKEIRLSNCAGSARKIEYVELPPQYQTWAVAQHMPTLKRQIAEICGPNASIDELFVATTKPRILEPIAGSVFAIDPTIPRDHQQLRIFVENEGRARELKLRVDDRDVALLSDQNHCFWRLTRGKHRLELVSKSGDTLDEVVFSVL